MPSGSASSGAFNVDLTEVTQLAEHLRGPRVRTIIGDEMLEAGQRSGRTARDSANRFITNKSGNSSGRLARSAEIDTAITAGPTFTTEVVWSVKGVPFDYALVHDKGRGPVFASPGKVLHFFAYGKEFFRKSVGPAEGSHFTDKGLSAAVPAIQAEHDRAARNIARKVEALQ